MTTTTENEDICSARHGGNRESAEAFARALKSHHSRVRVLEEIKMAGNRGVTCRELADQWGTGMNCISGRFSELKRDGQIAAKGRRDGCAVYVCTPDDAGTKDHPIQNQPHSTRLLSRVMEAEKELHHGLRPTAPFIRTWLNDRINLRDVPALSRIEVPVPGEGILSVAIDDPELQDAASPLREHWMLAAEAYFWAAHHEEMRKFKGGKP